MDTKSVLRPVVTFAAGLSLFLAASTPQAALITWQLGNVAFDGGGAATGFVTVDNIAHAISTFDITTTGGTFAFHYTPAVANVAELSGAGAELTDIDIRVEDNSQTVLHELSLSTGTNLELLGNGQIGGVEQDLEGNTRDVLGGTISAVPEPTQLASVALGIALVISIGNRKRRSFRD